LVFCPEVFGAEPTRSLPAHPLWQPAGIHRKCNLQKYTENAICRNTEKITGGEECS